MTIRTSVKGTVDVLKKQIQFEKEAKTVNIKKVIYYPEGEVHILEFEEPQLYI